MSNSQQLKYHITAFVKYDDAIRKLTEKNSTLRKEKKKHEDELNRLCSSMNLQGKRFQYYGADIEFNESQPSTQWSNKLIRDSLTQYVQCDPNWRTLSNEELVERLYQNLQKHKTEVTECKEATLKIRRIFASSTKK